MKKLLLLTLTTLMISISAPSMAYASTAYVDVNGLVCDFCARALEKVFSKQEAVESIDVNLDTKIITVLFKDGQDLSDAVITTLVQDSGYDVVGVRRDD